jgi:hypothetical protein
MSNEDVRLLAMTTNNSTARRVAREWLSFNDLQAMGVVPNWQTLSARQKDPQIAFPRGRLFGPNTRRWHGPSEIAPWLASRPAVRDEDTNPSPATKRQKEGRRVTDTGRKHVTNIIELDRYQRALKIMRVIDEKGLIITLLLRLCRRSFPTQRRMKLARPSRSISPRN